MAPESLETVRVEALFVSDVDPDEELTVDRMNQAVIGSVRRYGARGCASLVAAEFSEHPELAVPRMSWVVRAVRSVYPTTPDGPPRSPAPAAA